MSRNAMILPPDHVAVCLLVPVARADDVMAALDATDVPYASHVVHGDPEVVFWVDRDPDDVAGVRAACEDFGLPCVYEEGE